LYEAGGVSVARLLPITVLALLFGLPLLAQTPQNEAPPTGLQTPAPPTTLLPLDTSTAAQLEDQGDNLRAHNFHLDALDSYKAAIRKKPSAVLYNKLGITYILLRHPADAEAAITRAIQMQKNYSDAWNNRASVYYMAGDFKRATKDYQRAIKINDQNASYHSNLGSAYFNRRDLVKASREYQIALKLDPFVFERSTRTGIAALMGKPGNHAEFEYMMAKLFAQSGDPANSLLHLRKALEEGYKNINNVYKDQEFATLRADQRFKDLMSQKPEAIPQ
jgi:tetratricopeptide (TPR) repeat protein